jgi:hypothetical protein
MCREVPNFLTDNDIVTCSECRRRCRRASSERKPGHTQSHSLTSRAQRDEVFGYCHCDLRLRMSSLLRDPDIRQSLPLIETSPSLESSRLLAE